MCDPMVSLDLSYSDSAMGQCWSIEAFGETSGLGQKKLSPTAQLRVFCLVRVEIQVCCGISTETATLKLSSYREDESRDTLQAKRLTPRLVTN